jgi:hypothetical protein
MERTTLVASLLLVLMVGCGPSIKSDEEMIVAAINSGDVAAFRKQMQEFDKIPDQSVAAFIELTNRMFGKLTLVEFDQKQVDQFYPQTDLISVAAGGSQYVLNGQKHGWWISGDKGTKGEITFAKCHNKYSDICGVKIAMAKSSKASSPAQ